MKYPDPNMTYEQYKILSIKFFFNEDRLYDTNYFIMNMFQETNIVLYKSI